MTPRYFTREAAKGKWTTTSALTKASQSGTYSLGAGGLLSTVGPLGSGQWKRGTGDLVPTTAPPPIGVDPATTEPKIITTAIGQCDLTWSQYPEPNASAIQTT